MVIGKADLRTVYHGLRWQLLSWSSVLHADEKGLPRYAKYFPPEIIETMERSDIYLTHPSRIIRDKV